MPYNQKQHGQHLEHADHLSDHTNLQPFSIPAKVWRVDLDTMRYQIHLPF